MKVTANVATQKHRLASLMKTVESIAPQVDELRIYHAECTNCDYKWTKRFPNVSVHKGKDVGSAAKFHFVRPNEYYLTIDDDLIYPPDYVQKLIEGIKKYGGYVSFHGRKLLGFNRNYYNGHIFFHCINERLNDTDIDVPGTGVGGFDTNEFNPVDIAREDWRNMDDVAIGYECARQNVKVTLLAHPANWVQPQPEGDVGIYSIESQNPTRQNALADKILRIKRMNQKVSIIIPYKVDRGWLQEAVDSVYKQRFSGEIELIMSQSDELVSYNFNRGVEIASGDYIKYLCDDDILPVDSIQNSLIDIEDGLALCGNAINFFPDGHKTVQNATKPTFEQMIVNNQIHGGSLMYHKSIFEKHGLMNESLWTGEEYEFNLRLLKAGVEFKVSHHYLYLYRRHDQQKSLGKGIDQVARQKAISEIKNKYR